MCTNNYENPLGVPNGNPQVPTTVGDSVKNVDNNFGEDGVSTLVGMSYRGHNPIDIFNKVSVIEGYRFNDNSIVVEVSKIAKVIRFVVGFDKNRLYELIKLFVPKINCDILANICENVCKDMHFKDIPSVLKTAIQELDDESAGNDSSSEMRNSKLVMPKLAAPLACIVNKYPDYMKPAILFSAVTLYAQRVKNVTVVYNDTEILQLLFLVFVLGESAVGKSHIDRVKDRIIGDIIKRDTLRYEEEQAAKESTDEPKRKGRKPKAGKDAEPVKSDEDNKSLHLVIQYVGSTTSITALAARTKYAGDLPLMMYDNEAESMVLSCARGNATNIWVFLRKGVEGSEYVQNHNGKETFSGVCHPHMNVVLVGQPDVIIPVLVRQIHNGFASRVVFATIKQEIGSERPHVKALSESDNRCIDEAIMRLEEAHFEGLKLKKVQKAIDAWLNDKAKEAILKCSYAIDHFRKRSAAQAYKAAALYFLLDGNRETKHTVDFAIYFAEYMLQQQLHFFGDTYNKQKEGSRGYGFTNNVNYFEKLNNDFTANELQELRRANGESTNVRMIISRWRSAKLIEDVEGKRGYYRKLQS